MIEFLLVIIIILMLLSFRFVRTVLGWFVLIIIALWAYGHYVISTPQLSPTQWELHRQ